MSPNNGHKPIRKRKSRQDIKEMILTNDPLRDYHTSRTAFFGELFVQQLPPWRLWTGRMMLTSDPIVRFALNVRNAALMGAEVEVKCNNPMIKKWVEDQWEYVWSQHRLKMCAAKEMGFSPLFIEIKEKHGLLVIDGVREFAPEDCRALQNAGKLCGMRVGGKQVFSPQSLWLTYNARYGSAYGVGCLRRMYPAWYEKWMEHGAKRLLQLRMIKDSYIGDIFWYPPNMIVELPDGTKMSWRDMLREIGENRLSGGALTLPRLYDNQGKELTGYSPPQDIAGGSQIFEWNDNVDEGIFNGADIAVEVVKAAETGSGFSGRAIPFVVVLSVCTEELTEIVQCLDEQVLRPLAWLNWGGDPDYQIVPKSLVDSWAEDMSGSAMGGGAIGGQPSQAPASANAPSPSGSLVGGGGAIQFGEDFKEEDHPRAADGKFTSKPEHEVRHGSGHQDYLAPLGAHRRVLPHQDKDGKWVLYDKAENIFYGKKRDSYSESAKAADRENTNWVGSAWAKAEDLKKTTPYHKTTESNLKERLGETSAKASVEEPVNKAIKGADISRALAIASSKKSNKRMNIIEASHGWSVAEASGNEHEWYANMVEAAKRDGLTEEEIEKVVTQLAGGKIPAQLLPKASQHAEESAVGFGDSNGPLHAPPGGVTIHGVKYKGGEFIPKEVINELSDDERRTLRAGSIARHVKARPELAEDHPEAKKKADVSKAKGEKSKEVSDELSNFVRKFTQSSALSPDSLSDEARKVLKKTVDDSPKEVFRGVGIHRDRISNDELAELQGLKEGDPAPSWLTTRRVAGKTKTFSSYTANEKLASKYAEGAIEIVLKGMPDPSDVVADLSNLTRLKEYGVDPELIKYGKRDKEVVLEGSPQMTVAKIKFNKFKPTTSQHEEESRSFSSTQFNLPGDLAFEVRMLGDRIPVEDLAGDGRELNPHITVKYGLHTDNADDVRRIVQDKSPVAVRFGRASCFPANEETVQRGGAAYDVVKIEIESEALRELNKAISEGTTCTDTFPEYKPHCTIAYVQPGLGELWASRLNAMEGRVAVFDRLIFSGKDRTVTPILLAGSSVQFGEDDSGGPLHAPPGGVTIHGVRYKGGEFIPHEVISTLSDSDKRKLTGGAKARELKTEGDKLKDSHQGSTGRNRIEGEKFIKSGKNKLGTATLEGEVYAALKGIEGIAQGEVNGEEIHLPKYAHVVGVDDVPEKNRKSLGGIVGRNETRINKALSALSSAGYSYNDPLQFGMNTGADKKLDLLDFSNVQNTNSPEEAAQDNLPLLASFYEQFGAPLKAEAVRDAREMLASISLARDGSTDFIEPGYETEAVKFAETYPSQSPNIYYTPNAREVGVKGVVQTPHRKGRKLILSPSPVSSEELSKWELIPVLEIGGPSQHEEAEQFEETEAIRKLREFIQRGTAAKLNALRTKITGLKEHATDSGTLAGLIERELRALQPELSDDLAATLYGARLRGFADVIEETPAPETETAPAIPPPEPPSVPETLFPAGPPPSVRFPSLEAELTVLRGSPVAVGANYRETAELVRQGAFAVTGDLTDRQILDVREILADTFKEGESKEVFIEKVLNRLEDGGPLSEAHLENVFRTNIQSAMSAGREQAINQPIVADHFPYIGYSATRDARTRANHKALETLGLDGTNIYRSDDPVFKKFRPPWDYQCRCNWYPVTVEQAAKKGVQEAVEWLDRAKAIAKERGGSFYQYLNDARPTSSARVSPPPFEPSPEFRREL